MIDFDEIFERIKRATSTRTQVELADILDIRQSSISDAKRRNSVPSDWYIKLFEQFGLNPDWLKKGTGPMYLRTDEGYVPAESGLSSEMNEDAARYGNADAKSTVLSVMNASAKNAEQTSAGRISVPQSFVQPGLQVIKAQSSGMAPVIMKDAFVGVDTRMRSVASGEIYAVRLAHEGVVFKRLFLDAQNSRIILRSDNPEHPEIYLPLEDHPATPSGPSIIEEQIIGQVAWVLQRV